MLLSRLVKPCNNGTNALVHQSSGGQLGGEPMSKDLVESALVMIKPLDLLTVHPTNIHDDVAGFEYSRVSGPLEFCGRLLIRGPARKGRNLAGHLRPCRLLSS